MHSFHPIDHCSGSAPAKEVKDFLCTATFRRKWIIWRQRIIIIGDWPGLFILNYWNSNLNSRFVLLNRKIRLLSHYRHILWLILQFWYSFCIKIFVSKFLYQNKDLCWNRIKIVLILTKYNFFLKRDSETIDQKNKEKFCVSFLNRNIFISFNFDIFSIISDTPYFSF